MIFFVFLSTNHVMNWKLLKPVRVIVSLIFFCSTLFIFIDFAAISSIRLINAILYLQFIPSLINFLALFSLASAGILFILALTLLFGRIYCSSVCPLGTLHDIIIGINIRLNRKKKFRFQKSIPWIRYIILILTTILLVFGNMFLLTLLDPYSLSGKFFSDLFRPVFYAAKNLDSILLLPGDVFPLYVEPMKFASWPSLVISGVLFIAILVPALFKDRWFCTEICPVGTLLGLLSYASLFKIWIDETDCMACGTCSSVCKSGCISYVEKKVDFSRCIACYNCLKWCPHGGMKFTIRNSKLEIRKKANSSISTPSLPPIVNNSRRDFLKTTVLIASALTISKSIFSQQRASQEEINPYPVLPPGSISFWHFTEKCTSCHLCISACPTNVLQPAFLDYGLTGILQPKMDFETNYCNFDCVICTEICSTGAILPQTIEQKQLIQIGVPRLIKNLCIPVDERTACGVCSEYCPTRAIEMIPYLGELKIPELHEKHCVGCGACEYVCPTRPIRAIYVEPLLYHRKILKSNKETETKQNIKRRI